MLIFHIFKKHLYKLLISIFLILTFLYFILQIAIFFDSLLKLLLQFYFLLSFKL